MVKEICRLKSVEFCLRGKCLCGNLLRFICEVLRQFVYKVLRLVYVGNYAKAYSIYVTGCGPSASACALRDLGELRSLTERDSSFPCSTSGAVPSVPTRIQESISSSQPVYDRLEIMRNTKDILNTRCINHSCQGEGDPKRRV